jgi:hypothetical protein
LAANPQPQSQKLPCRCQAKPLDRGADDAI